MEKKKLWRIVIYLSGILMVSLGIVLCKKSNLGISPVSSIPFVLESVTPYSFGTWTMLFHLGNIALQLVLTKKLLDVRIWLQVPVAFLFGTVIDVLQGAIRFDGTVPVFQWAALVFSAFFTALGMVCMITMDLIQNPPDGLVRRLSVMTGKELGQVKIGYDAGCVIVSACLSLALAGGVKGMGPGTVVSAVFVGKMVTWMRTAVKESPLKSP